MGKITSLLLGFVLLEIIEDQFSQRMRLQNYQNRIFKE